MNMSKPMMPITTLKWEELANEWLESISSTHAAPYLANPKKYKCLKWNIMNNPHSDGLDLFGDETKLQEAICYATGRLFAISFYNVDDEQATSFVYFCSTSQGVKGQVHGGFVATVMDTMIGVINDIQNVLAFTANLTVNYKFSCPFLETLIVTSKIDKIEYRDSNKSRKIYLSGEMRTLNDDQRVIATGNTLWIAPPNMKIPPVPTDFNERREENLHLYHSLDNDSYYVSLPFASERREEWFNSTEIQTQLAVHNLLNNPNVIMSRHGISNGYVGDPMKEQEEDLSVFGGIDGKMFHLLYYNKKTMIATCFVKFLSGCEGPPGCAHGGSITTALDETMFIYETSKREEYDQSNDIKATASISVNFRHTVPLNTTLLIKTNVDNIIRSSNGLRSKCFQSFQLTSLDGSTVYNDGEGLVISNRDIALKMADDFQEKKKNEGRNSSSL